MFRVQFSQPDFKFFINELETAALPRIFNAFAQFREQRIAQQFASEVDPYGNKQAPLSAAYAIYKLKAVGNKEILAFTDEMKNSHGFRIRGTLYTEYFNDRKAVFHQKGTSRLPKRELLPTSDRGLPTKDQREIERLAKSEIEASWARGDRLTLEAIAQVTADDVQSTLSDIANYANNAS